jgi:hypothetical protein
MHFAYDERDIDQNAYTAIEHDRDQKELRRGDDDSKHAEVQDAG